MPATGRLTPLSIVLLYAAFAVVWIVVSGYWLTTSVDDPVLQQRIELAKGLAFVIVSSGLLYFLIEAWRVADGGETGPDAVQLLKGMRRLLPALIGLALTVPLIGSSVVAVNSSQTEGDAKTDLGAIAELKAAQIEYWLAERRGDAATLAGSTGFIMRVAALQRADVAAQEPLVRDRIAALLHAFSYEAIVLLDAREQHLLTEGRAAELTPETLALARKAMVSGELQTGELYRASNGEVMLDLVAPLILRTGGTARAQGVAVLQVNAARFLFPLIKSWPTSSDSGETLVARRDGDAVLYLNHLRFRAGDALTVRIPLSAANVSVVQAVLAGKPGTFSGVDYRGVPVLAAYRPVAGTNWQLVAKMDRAEVMAPLYKLAQWVSLIGLFAVVAVAATLVFLWRQQRVADQLAAKLQTGEMFKKFHDLPLVGLATISPQTGRWENFNDHLCVILGYSREALVAKTWIDVAHPDDLAAWRAEGDRITRKEIDAYTLDTRLVRHYGEVVFATINIRAVRGGDGSIESIFATVQDITERKRAEASLRRLTQLYAALGECNAAIMRAGAEAQVFQHVTRIVVGLGGMKMAWIGMVDSATQMIRPVASAGEGQEYLEDLKISVDPSSEYGNGPTGTAVREGRALWSQNFQTDPATAPWHARGSQFGWRGSASLPLNRAGRAVGSLTVYAPVYDAFDSDAQNLLIKLAEQISFAMDNFDRENERRKAELSLRESEVRNSALVKAIPDLIFTNRRDGEYLDFEASDPGFLAAKPDTFLHKSVYDVLPAPVAQQFMQAFAAALDSHALRQITYSLAFGLEVKQFEARVVPYEDDKVISIVRDITEKERAQAEIAASEERFRSLVDQVISGIYIVQDGKFTYVNRRFAQIAGYDSPDEVIGLDALSLIAEPERAFVREQMRSRFSGETPSGSYTTVGLRKGGSTVDVGIHGALATFGGKPAVIGMMQDISEKKRAEDQAARYLAQLQTAFMRTVEVATTISEMRDPYTAGHEKRVAKIAMAIGAEMGFDAQRLEGLRVGGYLHDVGKITIPAEILAKPGKLSAIEYELIKGHAQAGYDILKDVEFPWPVAQMAYQHHERLDGSGYPRGLKGEAILLEARIMAVADTVEAMSSHRPYRAALGKEKALEEIARGRGSAYDPVVADACLRLFREKDYALPD